MNYIIEYEDQFGVFRRFIQLQQLPSARRTAKLRAQKYGTRYRISDDQGCLVDLLMP